MLAQQMYNTCRTDADKDKDCTGDVVLTVKKFITDQSEEKNESGEIIRVRLPKKRNREIFAIAELMMGANHIRVKCGDGVTRMGRIKGKIKKRVWIREGDILIVIPWSFQDDKCDIIYRYTNPQVEWLRRAGYL